MGFQPIRRLIHRLSRLHRPQLSKLWHNRRTVAAAGIYVHRDDVPARQLTAHHTILAGGQTPRQDANIAAIRIVLSGVSFAIGMITFACLEAVFQVRITMGNRRFTRLTNAFSKKVENHVYALAIYFMHYNFVRIHQTTRVTPAMAAGVTQTLWSLADIVRIVDQWEAGPKA